MRRFGLRDDQWERIKNRLPGREGSVGVTAADNRLVGRKTWIRVYILDQKLWSSTQHGDAVQIVLLRRRTAD